MIQCCKIVSAEERDFICRNLQVKNLSFKIFEKINNMDHNFPVSIILKTQKLQ